MELLTVTAKQEGRSWEERRGAGFDMLIFIWQKDIWRRFCRSSLNYKCEQKGSEEERNLGIIDTEIIIQILENS